MINSCGSRSSRLTFLAILTCKNSCKSTLFKGDFCTVLIVILFWNQNQRFSPSFMSQKMKDQILLFTYHSVNHKEIGIVVICSPHKNETMMTSNLVMLILIFFSLCFLVEGIYQLRRK